VELSCSGHPLPAHPAQLTAGSPTRRLRRHRTPEKRGPTALGRLHEPSHDRQSPRPRTPKLVPVSPQTCRRSAAGTGWDSWRRRLLRVGSSHVRQAPIWVEEVGMTRSDRRIDRPLLQASCPVCGHVRLGVDGCPGHDATCCGQLSGDRSHCRRLGGTAAALLPQPQRSCPLVVVPVDTDGPLAARWTAGVRHPGRIAGQSPEPCRTTAIGSGSAAAEYPRWCPAAGRSDPLADTR